MAAILRTPGDVGALLRERRRVLGLDQAELARRVGVSRLWVNQVERGKPGASLGLVLRALAAVGVELSGGVTAPAGGASEPAGARVVGPDIDAIVAGARRREHP